MSIIIDIFTQVLGLFWISVIINNMQVSLINFKHSVSATLKSMGGLRTRLSCGEWGLPPAQAEISELFLATWSDVILYFLLW